MTKVPTGFIVVRQLSASDFGLFAEPRDRGLVASKQRAINFNAAVISQLLPRKEKASGAVFLAARCTRPGVDNTEKRTLSKVGKNWRFGGKKVPGEVFVKLREGDLFLCKIDVTEQPPYPTEWTVVMQATEPNQHAQLSAHLKRHLCDRMALIPAHSDLAAPLIEQISGIQQAESTSRKSGRLTVKDRLRQPHILQEMMKVSLSLSSKVQSDFLTVLESVAGGIRDILMDAGMIRTVSLDHKKLWSDVKSRPMAFVDGGTASFSGIGSEPIAVRVGSYTVIPGHTGTERESFEITKQLVDELFEFEHSDGFFRHSFDDPGKLRDAARISLEISGALATLSRTPTPDFLFLHGTLVNPVSPYALEGFPDFTEKGLQLMFPGETRQGRDRNFVSVYLELLNRLANSGVNVCGVVERASSSTIVLQYLFELLRTLPASPGDTVLRATEKRIYEYRISDAVLFHCILNEGEYIVPIQVNRNDIRHAPDKWKDVVSRYPKPHFTYVGAGQAMLPLRVEFFYEPRDGFDLMIRIITHSCRLMPRYAFPAGLDIADKYAKVPMWMSKPVNTTLAVQFMRKALDTGNPMIIEEAKRMLCGTTRDWLFRPGFNR